MTIKEFAKQYYLTEKEMDQLALHEFCDHYLDVKHSNAVAHALLRSGVNSIQKLHGMSVDYISKMRNIGSVRLNSIIELKEIIAKHVTD